MAVLQDLLILFSFFLINVNRVSRASPSIGNEVWVPSAQTDGQEKTDVIQFNVAGEIIATTRQTLTSSPQSVLSILFNGRWEHRLPRDANGIIFLDFNPLVFRHLLDQLQFSHLEVLTLPADPSLVRSFQKMIKKLQFQHVLPSEKNTVTAQRAKRTSQIQPSNNSYILDETVPKRTLKQASADSSKQRESLQIQINQLKRLTSKHEGHLKRSAANDRKQLLRIKELGEKVQLLDQRLNKLMKRISLLHARWNANGETIAGGNNSGNELNQLTWPGGIYVDEQEQSIYVADGHNNRIVKWKIGEKSGEIMASSEYFGNRTDQLYSPSNVLVDQKNKSLIMCDSINARIVRWSFENQRDKEILIENVHCGGFRMNEKGDLFAPDHLKDEVKRWRRGEKEGTVVAGGNGKGNQLNQLNYPIHLFVDGQETVYVSDSLNHRVMKWIKGAKEGLIVAGGQGNGNSLTQLSDPRGVIVNEVGDLYVADSGNHRVVCWASGSREGRVVAGGNGKGWAANQLYAPKHLWFDTANNLYVVDQHNDRVQRFAPENIFV